MPVVKGTNVLLETIYGHRLFLPRGRIPYQQGALEKDGVYEPATSRLLYEVIRPGMRVAECGANCGYHALNIAKAIGPDGKVWCFEANPELIPILRENLGQNGYADRTRVINAGIWARDEYLDFPMLDTGLGTASFKKGEQFTRPSTRVARVRAMSLDSFFGESWLDLIRMDIEGAELEALEGARNLLRRCRPMLIFEWTHENSSPSESALVYDLLMEFGYRIHRITNTGLLPVTDAESLHQGHRELCEAGQRDLFCSVTGPAVLP